MIQNTANRHVRNLFCLLAVFISFPLARCAPPPHPAPLFGGRESTKKNRGHGRGGRGVLVLLVIRARSELKRKRVTLAVRPGPTRFTCLSTGGALLVLPSNFFSPFCSLSPSYRVSRSALGVLKYRHGLELVQRYLYWP
jgi:hypothetical protein